MKVFIIQLIQVTWWMDQH